MPIYSWRITTNPLEEKTTKKFIKGDYITKVIVRFPPGPQGLLHVRFYYGDMQIFPEEKDTDFADDDLAISWEEFFYLDEKPFPLTIWTKNEDDTYPHTVHIYVATLYEKQLLAKQIADAISRKLGGVVRAIGGLFR